MQIIPVLDVLEGTAVHAIAGQRAAYRPLRSQLTNSTAPLAVARALRAACPNAPLYVADLDAIIHRRRGPALWRTLATAAGPVWLDAGVMDSSALEEVLTIPDVTAILGLECCPNADWLGEMVDRYGSERLIFSLDLQGGRPLTGQADWLGRSPLEIAEQVLTRGIRRLIVLDLADVGMSTGGGTADLVRSIQSLADKRGLQKLPGSPAEIYVGGGIRNREDVGR